MPVQTGSRIGPYEIETALGAGGMGEVYRARDTRLNRRVAIKSVPTNTLVELRIPEWTLEILRHSDSQLKIGDILREALPEIRPASFRKHLYLLYLLALINLRPASAP